MWLTRQSFSQIQHYHQEAVAKNKHEEAFNHDRDYICRIQTELEPFSSKSMPYFIEWWNFRINFGNSMAKNHSPGKQLCGSVQDSINNLTTGKSIKAIASRSTATATLASLDIVNWTRLLHEVHGNQFSLIDTLRLNFSKTSKEKKCWPDSFSKIEQSSGTTEISLPELTLIVENQWRYAEPFGRFV